MPQPNRAQAALDLRTALPCARVSSIRHAESTVGGRAIRGGIFLAPGRRPPLRRCHAVAFVRRRVAPSADRVPSLQGAIRSTSIANR
jgi:hypothetical protein